jgi:hypothetical protein
MKLESKIIENTNYHDTVEITDHLNDGWEIKGFSVCEGVGSYILLVREVVKKND